MERRNGRMGTPRALAETPASFRHAIVRTSVRVIIAPPAGPICDPPHTQITAQRMVARSQNSHHSPRFN